MFNNYRDIKPQKDGNYLCVLKGRYYKLLSWANNLYVVDDWNFENCKNKSGWYDYDSEIGCYECKNVLAWMPLPAIPEEYR